ncbi:outer membrane protein assembly factor BamE [Leclercia adecarboxylata]|uniref:outer membrane protein assembly factor BamE domain-containing protein n=1 Tax=Leclercia adecarboxylata TaxID=83655 RepID=UPI0022B77019|nr:outer membrane protein assembly factor BamE [Leclercia adecarboxylata]MCZ7839712.1 outer membrane protein assembly factor BamE [Leclercia adecarboxylata]
MRWLIVMMALVTLSGCANKIDYNRASLNLAIGMSKTEVQSLMGAPRRTDVNTDRERWIYWNPVMVGFTPIDNEQLAQDRLVVTFVENKVTKWGKQTIADDMSENTQKIYQSISDSQQKSITKQQ